MLKKKSVSYHEHATWWDRNEEKLLIYCFISMILLLLAPFFLIKIVNDIIWLGVIWISLLFSHSFIFYICMSRTEDLH